MSEEDQKTAAASLAGLAEKLAGSADAQTKAFLGAVLKASEAQGAELAAMRENLAASEAAARTKILRAELRAAAKEAGAVNVADVLAFVDVGAVTFGADGEPANLGRLVKGVKDAKPYLFGAANTSATHAPPPVKSAEVRDARDLKPAEYRARLRELGVDASRIRRR
jgi:hypothetical protein